MSHFLSAVFTRTGAVLCDPEHTDSHEHLIAAANLRDDVTSFMRENVCRVEFTPPNDSRRWGDLAQWRLSVDEDTVPDWFDMEKARETLSARVERMFVRDARDTLLGGCWIFDGRAASVKALVGGRIVGVLNDANLDNANLDNAKLARANLTRANLAYAYLSRANLYRANLTLANLYRANLSGANLYRANLTLANLVGADLSGAHLDCATGLALPAGWVLSDDGIARKERP